MSGSKGDGALVEYKKALEAMSARKAAYKRLFLPKITRSRLSGVAIVRRLLPQLLRSPRRSL